MAAEQYQYECRLGGSVKAYKKMTYQKAQERNHELEKRGAYGRWVPTTWGDSARR